MRHAPRASVRWGRGAGRVPARSGRAGGQQPPYRGHTRFRRRVAPGHPRGLGRASSSEQLSVSTGHRPRARSAPARRALAGDCRSAEGSGHLSPREPAPGPQLIGHPTGALLRHKSCNPVSVIKLLPCKEDRRQDLKEPKFVFVFVTMGFGSTVYRCNFCFLGAFFLIKKLASCVLQ